MEDLINLLEEAYSQMNIVPVIEDLGQQEKHMTYFGTPKWLPGNSEVVGNHMKAELLHKNCHSF